MFLFALLVTAANASIDPACQSLADQGAPSDYNEQAQADFLLNYFSLATTFSPLHAAVPGKPGKAFVGLEVSAIPPLGCVHRLVLSYSKSEDTNKSPAVPRPRVLVTLPAIGKVVPYVGLGYVPPVTVFGTRNVIASGEIGAGAPVGDHLDLGARYHYTMMKTVADIATAFNANDPAVLDFYSGSSFGADLMGDYKIGKISPYLAVGFTDVSTFFYIGDDGFIGNNCTPYDGPVASLGADGKFGHVDVAAEFYAAPKNMNPGSTDASCVAAYPTIADPTATTPTGYNSAQIYTGRLRVAYAF